METNEFRKLLFNVAFCTMACDGHIDDAEIAEIKVMDKKSKYFSSIDLSKELSNLIALFKNRGTKVIGDLFNSLEKIDLNPIQELLVLEIAIRIINADDKHDDNELKFLHLLRSKLSLHDEMIVDRFGKLNILHTSEYLNNAITDVSEEQFSSGILFPELVELDDISDRLKRIS